MRIFEIFALTISFAWSLPATSQEVTHQISESTITAISEIVGTQADTGLLSGIILVAQDDQILFLQTFGFANWEHRLRNSQATRFGIASITKSMTGTLFDMLVNADRLDPDSPVEKFIPNFPRGPNGVAPTIGHLLTHRAGVPHRVTDQAEESQFIGTADIVRRIEKSGLMFEPGTRRSYSSAGYTALARVIELVENKPFDAVLAERVFGPAGMISTTGETGQRLMAGRALAYRLGIDAGKIVVKSSPYKDLRFLTGAGSVFATAEDLVKFVMAIKSGVFGDDAWQQVIGGDPRSWQGMAGRNNGYEASVDVLADKDLIFVFLANLQSASNWQLRGQVQAVLLGAEPVPSFEPPRVSAGFEDPRSILGTYGRAEITMTDDTLFRGENEFYPVAGASYYIPASGTTMQFSRDSDGKVDALTSTSGGGRESVLPKATAPP